MAGLAVMEWTDNAAGALVGRGRVPGELLAITVGSTGGSDGAAACRAGLRKGQTAAVGEARNGTRSAESAGSATSSPSAPRGGDREGVAGWSEGSAACAFDSEIAGDGRP